MSFISLALSHVPIHEPITVASRIPGGGAPTPKVLKVEVMGFPKGNSKSYLPKERYRDVVGRTTDVPTCPAPNTHPVPRAWPFGITSSCKCTNLPLKRVQPMEKMASVGPLIPFPNGLCSWNPLMRSKLAKHIYVDVDSGPEAFDDLLIDPPNLVPPWGPC